MALIANGAQGLKLVDMTNPLQPVDFGSLPIPGRSSGVDGGQGVAYVVNMDDQYSALTIVDIRNPRQPVKLGAAPLIYGAERVRAEGSFAYVAGVANAFL